MIEENNVNINKAVNDIQNKNYFVGKRRPI